MERIEGRNFFASDVIFREGDNGDCAYVLIGGKIRVTKTVRGQEKVVAELEPFAIFGEMALYLEDHKRTATVTAVDAVRTMVLNKDNFEDFMRQSPQILGQVIQNFSERIHTATTAAMPADVASSIGYMLALLASSGLDSVAVKQLEEALSGVLNAAPATIRGEIERLAQAGLVELDGATLRFDPDAGRRVLMA